MTTLEDLEAFTAEAQRRHAAGEEIVGEFLPTPEQTGPRRRRPPGRPAILKKPIKTTIAFEEEKLKKLSILAKEEGKTVTEVIRQIIDEFLDEGE